MVGVIAPKVFPSFSNPGARDGANLAGVANVGEALFGDEAACVGRDGTAEAGGAGGLEQAAAGPRRRWHWRVRTGHILGTCAGELPCAWACRRLALPPRKH